MKITSAEFEISAPTLAKAPRLPQPEFALIGRSNVGKSSLLNLLTDHRDLARVSDLPGKTRLMNFYSINRNWRLVDLPGYGFAKVSKADRANFNEAAANYIEGRENLRGVLLLIDSRQEPQAIDLAFLEWLVETNVPFAVVFTKVDKQSAARTQANVDYFRRVALDGLEPAPKIFLCSTETKAGRNDLLRHLDSLL